MRASLGQRNTTLLQPVCLLLQPEGTGIGDKKGTQAFRTCVPKDCVTLCRCQMTERALDADAEVLFQGVHNAIPFLVRFRILERFLRRTHGQTEGEVAA